MSIITLKVIPKSSCNEIVGWMDSPERKILKVKITVAPEKGKATKALLKFLAAEWKVSESELELVSGATACYKQIKIHHSKLYEAIVATQK